MGDDLFAIKSMELAPLIGELHWSYRAARVLHVASRLAIFTRLEGKRASASEIANDLSSDPHVTDNLLIALCAMGLLDKVDGKYGNTHLAETFLVSGAPLYQGNIIAHSSDLWDFWTRLEAVVRTGRRDAGADAIPPLAEGEGHRNFILGMHNISATGAAQMMARAVDLSASRRLLDVGGGPGTYAIAFCQLHPQLEVVLLDLPETLKYTEKVVAEFGLTERIHLQPGDWGKGEFGGDFDAVLLSMIMHGKGSQADMKLGKAYRALNDGGLLLVQEFLLNADKTGPLSPALFNLMVGAYSTPELLAEIEAAGFVGAGLRAVGDRGNCLVAARKQ